MLTLGELGDRYTGILYISATILKNLKLSQNNSLFKKKTLYLATDNIFLIVLNQYLGEGSFIFFYLANRKQIVNIMKVGWKLLPFYRTYNAGK